MARRILRHDQWEWMKPLLPGKAREGGITARDKWLFIDAVRWMLRTGAPWRDLPPEFGNWHSTSMRFSGRHKTGVWNRVFAVVSGDADVEEVFLDSTAIRAHLHAAGDKKTFDSIGKKIKYKETFSGAWRGSRFSRNQRGLFASVCLQERHSHRDNQWAGHDADNTKEVNASDHAEKHDQRV